MTQKWREKFCIDIYSPTLILTLKYRPPFNFLELLLRSGHFVEGFRFKFPFLFPISIILLFSFLHVGRQLIGDSRAEEKWSSQSQPAFRPPAVGSAMAQQSRWAEKLKTINILIHFVIFTEKKLNWGTKIFLNNDMKFKKRFFSSYTIYLNLQL